jgi:hypothetical protein
MEPIRMEPIRIRERAKEEWERSRSQFKADEIERRERTKEQMRDSFAARLASTLKLSTDRDRSWAENRQEWGGSWTEEEQADRDRPLKLSWTDGDLTFRQPDDRSQCRLLVERACAVCGATGASGFSDLPALAALLVEEAQPRFRFPWRFYCPSCSTRRAVLEEAAAARRAAEAAEEANSGETEGSTSPDELLLIALKRLIEEQMELREGL